MTHQGNWTGDDHEDHDDDEMIGIPNWSQRDIVDDEDEDGEGTNETGHEEDNNGDDNGEEEAGVEETNAVETSPISDFFTQVALYSDEEEEDNASAADPEAEDVSFGYIEPLDEEGFPHNPDSDEEGLGAEEADSAEGDENGYALVDDEALGHGEEDALVSENDAMTPEELEPETPSSVAHDIEVLIGRWLSFEERYHSNETFKTALLLPILTKLGYDVYDPREVEPIESDTGHHEGYRVNARKGHFLVLLNNSKREGSVIVRALRSGITVEVLVDRADPDGNRLYPVITVDIEAGKSAAGLERLHKDGFDEEAIVWLASQLHGNQEHILEAMKAIITKPGTGFIADVREHLVKEGHSDLDMLEQRIALLAPTLFTESAQKIEKTEAPKTAPVSNETGDEDVDKGRALTPAEQQAFEKIRDLCGPEIAAERIFARPAKTYLAVLLDDNNRRTIARLHFAAAKKKYVGVFSGKEERKEKIDGVADIDNLAESLRKRAAELDPEAFA